METPRTDTAAGGTHPTGMHSYFFKISEKLHEIKEMLSSSESRQECPLDLPLSNK